MADAGVFSSELCRFCKYNENRDIAKEVLREKGMKKIKFGVEGQLQESTIVEQTTP